MAVNIQQVAEILCEATTEEIAAINVIIGATCGMIVETIPPGSYGPVI